MTFLSISRQKFESVYYGRTPFVQLFSTELAWYCAVVGEVTLLGVLLRCEIDKDFNAIILGRDLAKKYRAIDVIVSLESPEAVHEEMNARVAKLVNAHVEGLFPQGDEPGAFEIFGPKVSEAKRNHYLRLLLEDAVHFPAKVMMEELAYWFKDPDGNFIRGVQGNEFNSRLFELYLYAMFYGLDFEMDRSYAQPDFLLRKAGQTISVEATTVAEIDPAAPPMEINEAALDDLQTYVNVVMPFKFARTLRKKMRHRPLPTEVHYWELPHTQGHPFVLAVHDYSRRMSMTMSSDAMRNYLYGIVFQDGYFESIEAHVNSEERLPSNFFAKEENRFVSAVMLPTMATIPKFNRMGQIAGIPAPGTVTMIFGKRTDEHGEPRLFSARVDDPSYQEFWHEGTFVFHNPNAVFPLNPELFPHVIHFFETENGYEQWLPANYMISGTTQVIKIVKEGNPKGEEGKAD